MESLVTVDESRHRPLQPSENFPVFSLKCDGGPLYQHQLEHCFCMARRACPYLGNGIILNGFDQYGDAQLIASFKAYVILIQEKGSTFPP